MKVSDDVKLDYSDVLLVPQRSSLSSRKDVDLVRKFKFPHSNRELEGLGVIAANMDTTGTFAMAKKLTENQMFTALHKFYSEEDLVDFFCQGLIETRGDLWDHTFYTVGSSDYDYKKLISVKQKVSEHLSKSMEDGSLADQQHISSDHVNNFPFLINVDVANGYTEMFIETIEKYRKAFPNSVIMAGNVCTPNMAEELILKGADLAKIGIGGGSACLTRVKAGVGYPQFSANLECSHVAHGLNGHICSDGGCTCPGDIAKSFASGADFVMIGGMLAGTDCCEGDWVEINGESFFKFYGMSSSEAQEKHYGEVKDHRTSEGKCVTIPSKGDTEDVVQDIKGGISSACTYVGALRVKDLPKCAQFVKVNNQVNEIFGKSK